MRGTAVADDPLSLAPTTTAQQDITTAGQRRINLIWEMTQAAIAICVVVANMIVEVISGLGYAPSARTSTVLSNTLFLVVGFYFSRTNHAAIGGVGKKPETAYTGR